MHYQSKNKFVLQRPPIRLDSNRKDTITSIQVLRVKKGSHSSIFRSKYACGEIINLVQVRISMLLWQQPNYMVNITLMSCYMVIKIKLG